MGTENFNEEIINFFSRARADGKEVSCHPEIQTVFFDLNYTLLENHIGLEILRESGKKIAGEGKEIWENSQLSETKKIKMIAKLFKKMPLPEFEDICERAGNKAVVSEYFARWIPKLKPYSMVVETKTPEPAAITAIENVIDPLYNSTGERKQIILHATQIGIRADARLSGNVTFIPDYESRKKYIELRMKQK